MELDENKSTPLFIQISEGLENAILAGAYREGDQVPSTTELAVGYRINPATALKGINCLVDEGILYKQRGIGVFVKAGAVAHIKQKRAKRFQEDYLEPLLTEAERLDISAEQVVLWIKERQHEGN